MVESHSCFSAFKGRIKLDRIAGVPLQKKCFKEGVLSFHMQVNNVELYCGQEEVTRLGILLSRR